MYTVRYCYVEGDYVDDEYCEDCIGRYSETEDEDVDCGLIIEVYEGDERIEVRRQLEKLLEYFKENNTDACKEFKIDENTEDIEGTAASILIEILRERGEIPSAGNT